MPGVSDAGEVAAGAVPAADGPVFFVDIGLQAHLTIKTALGGEMQHDTAAGLDADAFQQVARPIVGDEADGFEIWRRFPFVGKVFGNAGLNTTDTDDGLLQAFIADGLGGGAVFFLLVAFGDFARRLAFLAFVEVVVAADAQQRHGKGDGDDDPKRDTAVLAIHKFSWAAKWRGMIP